MKPRGAGGSPGRGNVAFTLLEVMIAVGIFFMAIFAILALVSQNLGIARSLSRGDVDFGTVAWELARTNKLEEGYYSGDFGDFYPGATWSADVFLYSSNGLFQADITIDWPQNGLVRERQTSILLYRPASTVRPGGTR